MTKLLALLGIFFIGQLFVAAYAQTSTSNSPFDRQFGDVKFLNAYFGNFKEKMEVEPGDMNVPFTIVMSAVGTQDITGIRGELSLPTGFSSSNSKNGLIIADTGNVALAGEIFSLIFHVNLDKNIKIGQYPGIVKIDFSRLRESGTRNSFFNFDFLVTGKSILNIKSVDPFLTSIKNNPVVIQVSNDGTAPLSNVHIVLQNTQTSVSATAQSVTNLENAVFDQNAWNIGNVEPKSTKSFAFNIYVPEKLKDETLHAPMEITYFNAHGEAKTILRTIDFYVNGLIKASIYNVDVITLSKKQTVIGEVLNEGNVDGLFAFVTLEPLGNSNIKKSTQYIDKLEPDSPVPFNMPIEFEGQPREGEHDIRITVRYKDSLRNENTISYDTTIFYNDMSKEETSNLSEFIPFIIFGVLSGIGVLVYTRIKKKNKKTVNQTS
ncbi:MAG: COG1361 S-layer family protein [Nitrosopumilaceae archaeon]